MRQLTCRTKNSFQGSQGNEVNRYGSLSLQHPAHVISELSHSSCLALQSKGSEQRLKESAQVAEMAQWVKYLLLKCEDLYSNFRNTLKPGV